MAYKVRTDGTVECETAEEAVKLARLIQVTVLERPEPPRRKKTAGNRKAFQPSGPDHRAEKMMRVVSEAGQGGIPSPALASKLKLKIKGVGPMVTRVQRLIAAEANGHPVDAYFWKKKPRVGPAVWFADADKLRGIGLI